MKNIFINKHSWIIFAVFTLLALIASIWLPDEIELPTILFGVAVSHFVIALIVLIIILFIAPEKIKIKIFKFQKSKKM